MELSLVRNTKTPIKTDWNKARLPNQSGGLESSGIPFPHTFPVLATARKIFPSVILAASIH